MDEIETLNIPDEYELNPSVPEELPTPTFWPIVMASGVLFFFWGFLTSIFIWAAGCIVIGIAAAGWIAEFKDE
jgi:hypothetical protein